MTARWYVAQAERNREIAASMAVVEHGFEGYVPVVQKLRKVGRQTVTVSMPRFGVYIFVRFDAERDPWGLLTYRRGHRAYITRLLCNVDGKPSPVPDEAMDAVKSYSPPPLIAPEKRLYRSGERVTCIMAGVRREAVFVEYQGNRQFIRMWIFGSERVSEVAAAELEPVDEQVI